MKVTGIKLLILFLFGGLIFSGLQRYRSEKENLVRYRNRFQAAIAEKEQLIRSLEHLPELESVAEDVRKDSVFANSVDAETSLTSRLKNSGVILLIYKEELLKFWSSNQVLPDIHALDQGLTSQVLRNGQYLVFKYSRGQTCRVYLIEVRSLFDLQNTYLKNKVTQAFNMPDYIQVNDKPAASSLAVHAPSGRYLFSVRFDDAVFQKSADWLAATAWILLLGLFYLVIYFIILLPGISAWLSAAAGILAPIILRYIMLRQQLPATFYALKIFSPTIYSSGTIFYSLGDFFLNMFLLLWLITYLRQFSGLETQKLNLSDRAYPVLGACIAVMAGFLYFFETLFKGLVENSNIPMDLVNILQLNYFSLLALVLVGLLWLGFYLLLRFMSTLILRTGLTDRALQVTLIAGLIVFTLFQGFRLGNIIYPGLFGIMILLVFIRERSGKRSIWTAGTLIFILTISLVTALKLINYTRNREDINRISFAEKLQKSSDPVSEFLLKDNEDKISQDSLFSALVCSRQLPGRTRLFRIANQHLQKDYFGRSFAGYDLKTFLYDKHGQLISGQNVYSLKVFNSAAASSKVRKVSTYFYQLQGSLPSYFGIIPIGQPGQSQGTVVVWIVAKYIGENNAFPDLLMDGKTYFERRQEKFSYAYYENGSLLDKFGKYPYGITDREFTGTKELPEVSYKVSGGYNHLVYHADPAAFIIVSKPDITFFRQVAVFSYIMAFFLIAIALLAGLLFLIRIRTRSGSLSSLLSFLFRQRFLFKSRIQGSVILGVLVSLFIIGWVTLFYIQNQYKTEQKDLLRDKIDNLRKAFENEMPTDSLSRMNENSNLIFLSLATEQNSDLNFFDINGDLVFTSLAKLYDRGLVSSKMDPVAYTQMYASGRTELINNESIGELDYLSVYAPVRNSANQVVGYINFPYFANENEIGQKLSGFVSTLINVYVFVFLLIGLLAFVLANSITHPLALIQENLRRIKIGNVNEPLVWRRDDEIGDLIREYNAMVRALEESADKLARSERESAWREMARQVAHEIKNPLTPLKLGIQHLERAFKAKDPRFDDKFNKFSATFIQQIDSLSAIATEFSNFAQMPPAVEVVFDLQEIGEHALNLFKDHDQVQVSLTVLGGSPFLVRADKDQLQRALNNLVKNAIQAIPDRVAGNIEILLNRSDNIVSVEVCDNGTGIPDDIREKIFTPNFTTKSSGMGLGLAFVRNAVINARGKVTFSDRVSGGTCFSIELPRYTAFATPAKPATSV